MARVRKPPTSPVTAGPEAAADRVDLETFLHHPRPGRLERRAAGKGRRAEVPLEAHAAPPDAALRDAVEILHGQDADREASLLPLRYQRMSADPFSFLRGAAAVMASDLAQLPSSGISVQLCGDAHVSNFGMFASPDRRLLFDLNDFDETLRGPFEWDVKRLAASLAVAARANGLSDKQARTLVRRSVARYRASMAQLAESRTLDVWYMRVDADVLRTSLVRTALGDALKLADKKARRNTGDAAVQKMTTGGPGTRRFRAQPPILVPIDSEDVEHAIGDLYRHYLDTLPLDCALLLARYSFRGAAHRVVGVGSVGTRSLLVLLESGDGEPLLLQLKQAGPSVLEPHLGASRFGPAHGRRVVAGQRLMQGAGDPFLGWADTSGGTVHDYYVRQLRDMKGSVEVAALGKEALDLYGQLCAGVLARAHARAGDASVVSGYLGRKDTFEVAVADFALAYADITVADHAALASATSAAAGGAGGG